MLSRAAGYIGCCPRVRASPGETHLASPNYSYEKRQRELAKKRKAEDKRQRKLSGKPEDGNAPDEQQTDAEATPAPADPAAPQT